MTEVARVRFLVGRAGSGKTRAVVLAVRRELLADPVAGPRLLLLVPEQASLQTEAALLAPGGPGASERAEVLSFRRLARRVLAHAGVARGTVLTGPARAMLLRAIALENEGRLGYYRRVGRFSGFLEKLARTIEELIEEGVEPEALLGAAAPRSASAPAEPPSGRREKLADLALLYRAYLDALGPDRVDPSQLLDIARRRFAECPFLAGARVFVDGFAGFTNGERRALADLAALASEMTVAMLGDPGVPEETEAGGAGRLFRKTARTRLELRRAFAERGVGVEETIAVGAAGPSRFSRSPALAALERRLFAFPAPPGEAPAAADGVEIAVLPTRRLEAEYAASRIHDLVRESGGRVRFRDVAIVARDLEPYHDLLASALSARGVPFFVDRRRGIAHHPLVECVRCLARLVAEDFSIESVRLALKTDLLGLGRDESDALENALLAQAIEGAAAFAGEWLFAAGDPRLPALRDRFLASVRPLLEAAGTWPPLSSKPARTLTGSDWAAAIRTTLEALGVEEKLAAFAAEADAAGRADEADGHRRVAIDVDEFLESLSGALSTTPLDALALSSVIDAGLSSISLGLAPATADQVLVGAVERSRHPDLKAVFLIGLDDRSFPRVPSEDAILSDDDRDALRTEGLPLAPPRRERVAEEALLAYIAVTRPSERLVVTHAAADERGKALRPSPYVDAIRAALPALEPVTVGDPLRRRSAWNARSASDLAAGLAFELRSRPERGRDPVPESRELWNGLYESARRAETIRPRLRRALSSLVFDNRAEPIGERALAALRGGAAFAASVTRLESFARCPFQHFAKYTLSLREREEAALRPEEKGRLQHKILEEAIGAVARERKRLADVPAAEMGRLIDGTAERVASELPPVGARREAERRHAVERSRKDLRRVLEAQALVSRAGAFRPWRTELGFGRGESGDLAPLVVETPRGHRVELRGVIDRVDVAEPREGRRIAVVIDYKGARGKKLSLDEVSHGLSLQLTAYLAVLRDVAGAVPGGAFYVSTAPAYDKVDHPSDFDAEAALGKGPHRPRGIVAEDVVAELEGEFRESSWAPHYSLYKKADGTFGNIERSDGAPRAAFDALLAATLERIAALADGILAGEVAVAPYRLRKTSPCAYCPYRMACRFEFSQPSLRSLPALRRSEVLGIAPPEAARPGDA